MHAYTTQGAPSQINQYLGQEVQSVRDRSPMENVCDRLSAAVEQVAALTGHLSTIEQRLTGGSNAKEGTAATPRPVPNGHISQLNMDLDDLFARIDAATQIMHRLADAI